jgi:glycosidase
VVALNPEAVVLAGTSFEDEARTRPVDPSPWLAREAVDLALNHAFGAASRAFFLDKTAVSPAELDALLVRIRGLARPETALALPNPLDGPDGERAASRAVNVDREPGASASPRDNPRYDVRAPSLDEWRRVRLLLAFLFASPGPPLVTYGTEAGMWGAADPDALRPMVWREARHENDASLPGGQSRKADPVRFDLELFKHVQTMGRLRAAEPALRRGAVETLVADEFRRLYVFARVLDADRVVAAFNLTDKDQGIEVAAPPSPAREVLTGRRLRPRDGKIPLVVPAFSAAIVAPERAP